MAFEWQRAQAYQLLVLNEEMFRKGHIFRYEYNFIRRLQAEKLTNLHPRGTMRTRPNDLY